MAVLPETNGLGVKERRLRYAVSSCDAAVVAVAAHPFEVLAASSVEERKDAKGGRGQTDGFNESGEMLSRLYLLANEFV
jgi:hypothetical protein